VSVTTETEAIVSGLRMRRLGVPPRAPWRSGRCDDDPPCGPSSHGAVTGFQRGGEGWADHA
jgi:hypothetical protein